MFFTSDFIFVQISSILIHELGEQLETALATHHLVQRLLVGSHRPQRVRTVGQLLLARLEHVTNTRARAYEPIGEQLRLEFILVYYIVTKVAIVHVHVVEFNQTSTTSGSTTPATPVEMTKRFETHRAVLFGQERVARDLGVAIRKRLVAALTQQVVLIAVAGVVGRAQNCLWIHGLVLWTLSTLKSVLANSRQ